MYPRSVAQAAGVAAGDRTSSREANEACSHRGNNLNS